MPSEATAIESHVLRQSLRALVGSFDNLTRAEKIHSVVEVLSEIPVDDLDAHFEAARMESVGVEDELRNAEGGGLSAAEFAQKLGVCSAETIRTYRLAGKIFAWEKDERNFRYPAWQIYRGKILPGLSEVLAILNSKELPTLSIISFFIYPSDDLDGKSPLELLRQRQNDEVLDFAKRYGDIGT
jgi:hypothetical protein